MLNLSERYALQDYRCAEKAAYVFSGICILIILCLFLSKPAQAEEVWKVTAYDACLKCCGKTDGITASGKPAKYGYVACNWLKFGQKVRIEGLGVFTVQDRGARSQFGDKKHHIRHLDVYLPTHTQALKFGVKYLQVEVMK